MKRRITTTLLCCLLLTAAITIRPALARMYQWVDAQGNTHYTQSPPPDGIEGRVIKPPPVIDSAKAQEQLQNRQQLLDTLREKRINNNQAERQKKQDVDQQKARCEQAKARLASYQRPRVSLIGEDGSPSRATEEQRQAEITRSKEYVRELCK